MSEDLDVPPAMAGVDIPYRVVRTGPAGSAAESAALQGIELASLLRTIVVRRGEGDYVFVLVPAGRRLDWPKLRAHLGVRQLSLPDADEARAATGYERYTITPFGATHTWSVIADAAIDRPLDRRHRRRGTGRQRARCPGRSHPPPGRRCRGRDRARRDAPPGLMSGAHRATGRRRAAPRYLPVASQSRMLSVRRPKPCATSWLAAKRGSSAQPQ